MRHVGRTHPREGVGVCQAVNLSAETWMDGPLWVDRPTDRPIDRLTDGVRYRWLRIVHSYFPAAFSSNSVFLVF